MFKKMEKKQVLTLLSVSEHHLVCHLLSSAAIAWVHFCSSKETVLKLLTRKGSEALIRFCAEAQNILD